MMSACCAQQVLRCCCISETCAVAQLTPLVVPYWHTAVQGAENLIEFKLAKAIAVIN